MSIHRSLVTHGRLVRGRSVLTRSERLVRLQKEGRWKEGDSVFGLPKVRTLFKVAKRKKEAAPKEGEAAAATPEAAAAAAATPAKPEAAKKPEGGKKAEKPAKGKG